MATLARSALLLRASSGPRSAGLANFALRSISRPTSSIRHAYPSLPFAAFRSSRCYATNQPGRNTPGNDGKSVKEKGKADASKGEGEGDGQKYKLPDGWVWLTEEELTFIQERDQLVPKFLRSDTDKLLNRMRALGAPKELQIALQKMKSKKLTMIDAYKLASIISEMSERYAAEDASDNIRKQIEEHVSRRNSPGSHGQSTSASNKTPGQKEDGTEGKQDKQADQEFSGFSGFQGFQGQGKKTNPKDQKPEPRPTSWTDIVTLVIFTVVMTPFVSMLFGDSGAHEITWQEMRARFLERGLVSKMTVVGDKVMVDLNAEAAASVYPDLASNNPSMSYYFSIGSADSFERKLEAAQDELGIPASERIPVLYKRPSGLMRLFVEMIPTLLLIGFLVWGGRRGMSGGGSSGIFGMGKSRAKMFNQDSVVKVKFADVAGMDEAKTEIMEFVSFLKSPEKFQRLGAKIPRGAILSGPPGTGKTLLAKATAGESGVPFFSVSGSEFVEMFVGVGASRVRDLFATARRNAPCIIFVDEIDAIGRSRDSGNRIGGNDEREATLNQILTEMDGFNTTEQVVVLAGTNRPDVLDKALMRPGRFDRHIHIDRPTMKGRQEIFRVHLRKIVTNEDRDYLVGRLAALTPGFAGADIANVANEAALVAARANAQSVEMIHFEQAIERVVGGLERKSLVLNPEERRTVAYHEAGHAICGWYFQWADPLLKVSIIPRGQGALGYAQYLPSGDAYLMTVNQLMDRMAMTLGGRVSEEIHFPTVTSGASDDFKKVTRMATVMVTEWGMSEKLGPMHFGEDQNKFHKPFAESTAQTIDTEVRRIVDQAYKQCKDLLTARKKEIGIVAEELLRKEMLDRDDMIRLLGPRPFPDKEEFSRYFSGERGKLAPPPPEDLKGDTPPAPGPGDPTPAIFKRIEE